MRLIVPLLLLLAAPAGPALAQDCDAAEDQTTMTLCAGQAFDAADAALNQAWQELMRRLADDPEAKALAVTAQKAWIGFRDAECAFQASGSQGGSIHPMLVAQCQADLTTARTDALEAYLACEEGDLSCPVPPAP